MGSALSSTQDFVGYYAGLKWVPLLTDYQRTELAFSGTFFAFFYVIYFFTTPHKKEFIKRDVIITTLLFCTWYIITKMTANFFTMRD